MPSFTTAYNMGDVIYVSKEDGSSAQTTITGIKLRDGFNPSAFVAATDVIYTVTATTASGEQITRPEQYCFASKALYKAYIDTLP